MPRRKSSPISFFTRDDAINRWLNLSQDYLAREIGEERVNQLTAEFREAARPQPTLWSELYRQPDPYRWLYERAQPRH